jgi:hypothetical protein
MSFWNSINLIENSDQISIASVEKNASLGLTALYFGSKFSKALPFHEFNALILNDVNKLILNSSKTLINQQDRLLLINLSFLVHLTLFHEYKTKTSSWPIKDMPAKGKCAFPGCKNDGSQKDHIWPKSLGGPYLAWNCQWLCDFHNRMKSNAPIFGFVPSSQFNESLTNWMRANRLM